MHLHIEWLTKSSYYFFIDAGPKGHLANQAQFCSTYFIPFDYTTCRIKYYRDTNFH